MNEKDLLVQLIEKYAEVTQSDVTEDSLGLYLVEIQKDSKKGIARKTAARICHEFIKNVLGLPDLDWGEAAKIKDIYECRVCANSIAQVCIRGIMEPGEDGAFGLNRVLGENEINDVIKKVTELI